jgi:hypothetical protein
VTSSNARQSNFDALLIQVPPKFCQYAGGECDQTFNGVEPLDAFILYPSTPRLISETIEETLRKLRLESARVSGWRDLQPAGQIIFCTICKQMRFAKAVVTDVTTLNFNLLFEIGYAIGLGVPVIPVRDTTFLKDKRVFTELGILDTLGYIDFQNSSELATEILARLPHAERLEASYEVNQEQPLFLVGSPILTDASVRLIATIARTGFRTRTFDPVETTRISLHDAIRQVRSSLGVIVHLIDPHREGASVHNARGALIAGLAMADQKLLIMLQEGAQVQQPLDYRDLIRSYTSAKQIPSLLRDFMRGVVERFQATKFGTLPPPTTPLEKLDLGDVAAENEHLALGDYFVRTAQYEEVRRGHAQLVVGRKGSGKSAIFYELFDQLSRSKDNLVIDLRPEGHQFRRLREAVLKHLSLGAQEHLLTAFWDYLLAIEVLLTIIVTDKPLAFRNPDRLHQFEALRKFAERFGDGERADFTERLLDLEERISQKHGDFTKLEKSGQITQLIYEGDIRELTDSLVDYLGSKKSVWLLFDNIDKGLPVDGASNEDVLIIRCLMAAAHKLQRRFENAAVDFQVVVFLRADIFDLLVSQTPDRGKEAVAWLDWETEGSFHELIRRRIESSTRAVESFEIVWPTYFDAYIDGEPSFTYVLDRTFKRPRDVIRFLKHAINQALNRGHLRVLAEDFQVAERLYSEDQLTDISFELRDISPSYDELLYNFIGERRELTQGEVYSILLAAKVADAERMVKSLRMQATIATLGFFPAAFRRL